MKDDMKELREGPWVGYIGFSIKAKDTEENQAIHDAFRHFCEVESKNDFTLGLKMLLEYFQGDMKYEMMYDMIKSLEAQIVVLQQKKEEPKKEEKKDDKGMF